MSPPRRLYIYTSVSLFAVEQQQQPPACFCRFCKVNSSLVPLLPLILYFPASEVTEVNSSAADR
ncbi:hypothetical protein, unlikely [Trypanosoma brucei gambiense DAL972]|uniref:Uncharacterized protein n=1 Tax=Trypanosoma brucei gambiense (strain MHOM/CI/86/DAL972) TaxID=679716 RepID=D0A8N4_TRYB9|nr:hypothetical protein, unlikely [Trypanosoma brucei gambiense DAL972]CBH18035.1 hypothetical protein, unlikely [Trypanosoma brucei gambiense DAL972]|eukprot:XP_011780299.1 hypothetical protein, unlikely [Trypanosoma brucei gambiense DAL972]